MRYVTSIVMAIQTGHAVSVPSDCRINRARCRRRWLHRTPGAVVSIAEPPVCAPIDANGNLTSDGTKTYSWNALNQLVEVKKGATTIATFEYDEAGRRTKKIAAGLTYQYLYDAEDIIGNLVRAHQIASS